MSSASLPSPEELRRRELQRRKQKEARERQANGALSKKARKAKKRAGEEIVSNEPRKKIGDKKSAGKAWREKEFAGKGRDDFKKARKVASAEMLEEAQGRRKHDVVIVPIFWRQKIGEEEAVVADAERIKSMIGLALDVWIDRTHKKNPGQKYAFWEAVGVRHRIEIGPDDVKAKNCVVASTQGSYATAKRKTINSTSRKSLLAALQDVGLDKARRALEKKGGDGADESEDVEKQSQLSDQIIERWMNATRRPPSPDYYHEHNERESETGDNRKRKSIKIDVNNNKNTKIKRFDDDGEAVNDDELLDDQWAKDDDDE